MIKRVPGGKEFLRIQRTKWQVGRSCVHPLFCRQYNRNAGPDEIYHRAYDQLFILLTSFYNNGLRGDILEFGVLNGYTATLFAECMKRYGLKSTRLHLFDSFEGLPKGSEEDAQCYECANEIWAESAMGVPKELPFFLEKKLRKKLTKERLHIVKGYFDQTLEAHIQTARVQKALLVHLDCDLHSSSKYVLRTLMEHDLMQDGTILICDDWMTSFGNPNMGQRKAVQEILEMYPNWAFEPYFNYGLGSQVFVVHDMSIRDVRKQKDRNENNSCCTH